MRASQKRSILAGGLLLSALLLFPPWLCVFDGPPRYSRDAGFHFVFTRPTGEGCLAHIDRDRLLVLSIGIAIFTLALILVTIRASKQTPITHEGGRP